MKLIKNYDSFIEESHKEKIIAKDNTHLISIITNEIDQYGPNVDLNHIDVSNIKTMSGLFRSSLINEWDFSKFNGDISKWNVSNVLNMSTMFMQSSFNGDISNWNISNVEYVIGMFMGSEFNQDISNWKVENIKSISNIFKNSKIEKNNMPSIFNGSYYEYIQRNLYDIIAKKFSNSNDTFNTKVFKDDDDYFYISFRGSEFKCDGIDGIEEFNRKWKVNIYNPYK